MNRKKLIDKILENWTAKIICFLIAVFIYIFHQVTMLEKKTLIVPLSVEADGVLCPVSSIPKYIKVTVRSTQELIPSIYSSGFSASLDLTNITEAGSYVIPVSLSLSEGLLLTDPLEVSVKPETIRVDLDEKIMKYIPVEAAISGQPEHGYTVKDISITPSTVKVIGPASVIKKTKSIYTKKVVLTGAAKSFSNEVRLDNAISSLLVYPEGNFRVSVNVVPADYEKKMDKLQIKVLNLSEKLQLENELAELSLKLAGTMPVLEKFAFEEDDININFEGITEPGTYELPLNIKIPSSVAFVDRPEETISVSLIEKIVENTENQEVLSNGENSSSEENKSFHEEVKEEQKPVKEKKSYRLKDKEKEKEREKAAEVKEKPAEIQEPEVKDLPAEEKSAEAKEKTSDNQVGPDVLKEPVSDSVEGAPAE